MTLQSQLREISASARQLLSQYPLLSTDEERLRFILSLRPQAEDYPHIFQPASVAGARRAYEAVWQNPELFPLRPEQNQLQIAAASVAELASKTGLSAAFPSGYQRVLGHFRPETIVLCWEFMSAELQAGVAFDGLVPVGARWAWLPKPWRVLSAAATPVFSPWQD